MSQNSKSTPIQSESAAVGESVGSGLLKASDRRRMILSSLGKGSVVAVAAGLPLRSLATNTVRCKTDGVKATPVNATVSGMQSIATSMAAQAPTSSGHGCTHYGTTGNWPTYQGQANCRGTWFSTIFGGGSNKSCSSIVAANNSTECRWVVAYLNAHPNKCCNSTYNYPYTQTEIVNMYKTAGVGGKPTRAACESFFSTHMENKA